MSIDWFTFTAQIFNFLLLVWLLKRFLYGPIIKAMEEREARVAARLTDAKDLQDAATTLQAEYREKLDDQAKTRAEILATAAKEVDSWRENHLKAAKSEIETAREQWQSSLLREKRSLLRQLQLEVTQHSTDLCRHVLEQLADERLQSRLVTRFVSLLSSDAGEGEQLQPSIVGERTILVNSSHELNQEERAKIAAALVEIGVSVEPDFHVNPELICGIELRAAGCKLAWSFRDSVAELESDLTASIDELIPTESHGASAAQEELATS